MSMIYRGYDIEKEDDVGNNVRVIVKRAGERCKSFANEQAAMDAIDFHFYEKGRGR